MAGGPGRANTPPHMQKVCTIHLTVGQVEPCPGPRCPFWEKGKVGLEPGCALEGLELALDRPDLAAYLLGVRAALEEARDEREREAAREAFARAVTPPGLAGR